MSMPVNNPMSSEQIAEMRSLRDQGWRNVDIAEKFDINATAVSNYINYGQSRAPQKAVVTPGGPNPSGKCQCGCGEMCKRAREDHDGYLKGQYHRFVVGHYSKTLEVTVRTEGGPNPSGLCQCGCGGTTERAQCTTGEYRQGQYHRFIRLHQNGVTARRPPLDLRGQRQKDGYLVAVRRLPDKVDSSGKRRGRWLCRCLYNGPGCKKYTELNTETFTKESVRSCGCLWVEAINTKRNQQSCDNCGRDDELPRGSYIEWREYTLCPGCYNGARYRGRLEPYICQWPDCETRIGVLDGRKYCDKHERMSNTMNRGENPKDNERFYYKWTTIWQDLDDHLGEWDIFPAIDRHYDCLIWRGTATNGLPMWHGSSLPRLIYLRYVDPDYEGHVYRCTENALCIKPEHLNNKMGPRKKPSPLKGKKRPPEVKTKISAALTGKKLSPRHRETLSKAHKGVQLSAAHRKAMSKAQKERWAKRRAAGY